jgi:lipoprotein-anchoring transpeptidase ErfK/SrfK
MIAAGTILLLLLSAFAFDRVRADTIGQGVTVGGVDVSGLSREEARAKLADEVQAPLAKPLKISYNGKVTKLTPKTSGVHVDTNAMIEEAIDKSNSGFFVTNAVKGVAGVNRNVVVKTRVTYDEDGVKRFVAKIKKTYDQQPVDAKVSYSAKGLGEVDAKPGLAVKQKRLNAAIIAHLQNATTSRRIRVPMKKKEAKVTRKDLAHKYGTIIIVDRAHFKLRLYKKLKLSKTYGVAVGQAGLETPAGLYAVNDKQINPAWHVPNSAWAGKLAGTTVPPGPGNPLVARWMGVYDGVGIHGTNEPSSIGSAASHGCIRMVPAQVIDLYDRVPMGTPVYIS